MGKTQIFAAQFVAAYVYRVTDNVYICSNVSFHVKSDNNSVINSKYIGEKILYF